MANTQSTPSLRSWLAKRDLTGRAEVRLLKQGGWANAVVFAISCGANQWVLKDFSSKGWLVRNTIGRCVTRREWRTINRLQGLGGVPTEPFRAGHFAMGYRFVSGDSLAHLRSTKVPLGGDFFIALETLVRRCHECGFVHLDLRNGKNILVTTENQPCLIDFQAGLWVGWLPQRLRNALASVDYSGVYKWWARFDPHGLDASRRQLLENINRRRLYLWPFNRPHSCARLKTEP